MMTSTNFLREQLEANVQAWKYDHDRAMACWEMEARLKLVMSLYEVIQTIDRHWGQETRSDSATFDEAAAGQIGDLYRIWLKPSQEVIRIIANLRRQGYAIEGADAFEQAYAATRGLLDIPIERVLRASRQVTEGKGRPAAEVKDELRRRLGA